MSTASQTPSTRAQPAPLPSAATRPWWRHAYVWLVISGPLTVVVAGFATLWLALRTPDPEVPRAVLPRTLPLQHMGEGQGRMAPAQAVRNHTAATLGVQP